MEARPEQAQLATGENDTGGMTCPDHRPVLVVVVGVGLTYAACRRCRGATLLSRTPEGALAAFEAGWIEHRPERLAFERTPGGISGATRPRSGDEK